MWTSFKENYKISGLKLTFILSVCLFIIYSFWIGKMPFPYFTDEVGYWGCAAYLADLDWTRVTSKMAYFGYGYGIFLFPMFLLGDSQLIYLGALILNIIFVEGVFWMLIHILNNMFSKKYEIENIICAFTGCLYSAYIAYSHTTMSETCILFFLVLLVMLVQCYCETPKIIYGGLIALELYELMAIHLRNLIFVVVILIFLAFLIFTKKKKVTCNVITIFFVCSAVIMVLMGKNYIIANVFTDVVTNTHIDSNDNVSDRLWFVSQLLNIEWWKNYVINVLCKSFYLVLSSLFVIIYAVVGLVKDLRKQDDLSKSYFRCFLLLLLICSVLYTSLVMFAGGEEFRVDTLLYGRYSECIMPMFCAIGLIYFLKSEKSYKNYKIYFAAALIALVVSQIAFSYYKSNNIEVNYANIMPIQITGLSWVLQDKPVYITQAITCVSVLAYVLLAVIIYFVIKNKWISVATITVLWVTFGYIGWNAFGLNLNDTTDISSMSRVERMEKINEIAEYLRELDCEKVYYALDPESKNSDYYDMFTLQFDLVNIKLVPIEDEAISKIGSDNIIVSNYWSRYYNEIRSKSKLIYQNDLLFIGQGYN